MHRAACEVYFTKCIERRLLREQISHVLVVNLKVGGANLEVVRAWHVHVMHHVMHYVMHHVMHSVMHYVMQYVMH